MHTLTLALETQTILLITIPIGLVLLFFVFFMENDAVNPFIYTIQ